MYTQNPECECECLYQLYPELLKTGNNPKVRQLVNKLQYLYTVEYLLSNKKIQTTD